MNSAERAKLIEQYATGPARLRAAVEKVPEAARKRRPSDGEFSVHQIVCHCADSETNAHARIRYLIAEKDPAIVGYDPSHWAETFQYDDHPIDAALATVEAVRANTTPLLRRLPEDAWQKAGHHTESGRYSALDWLRIYSQHVEEHIAQIESAVEALAATG